MATKYVCFHDMLMNLFLAGDNDPHLSSSRCFNPFHILAGNGKTKHNGFGGQIHNPSWESMGTPAFPS